MASLDPYLKYAITKNAKQLVLRPGKKPTLVFEENHTDFGQPIHSTQIRVAMSEVLPPKKMVAFSKDGEIKVDYMGGGGKFKLAARLMDSGIEAVFFNLQHSKVAQKTKTAMAAAELPGAGEGSPLVAPQAASQASPKASPKAAASAVPAAPKTLVPAAEHHDQAIDDYLKRMVKMNASDIHICTNRQAKYRVDGELTTITKDRVLDHQEIETLLFAITPQDKKETFDNEGSCDFAYSIPGVARYRFNIYKEQDGISAAIRQIPSEILTVEDLDLPQAVLKLAALPKGLVLVTGPTGSGKSTTLAAIIDLVNRTRHDHIITIEAPIEFLHQDKKCLVHQREVGVHTNGFKDALRDVLREDPDVVLIGEMRDLVTISTAIETASTGHLVFGTLHTTTATSTINRIIEIFPADQQSQVRYGLAESLKAVISQVLLKKKGGGRVAALEILIINPSVANLIREQKTHQIFNMMQTGRGIGMQLLNEEMVRLVVEGTVEPLDAYNKAIDKDDLVQKIGAAGISFTPPAE